LKTGTACSHACVDVQLDNGRWQLLVRTRVRAVRDRLEARLDGKRIGGRSGIVNTARWLGRHAWVWSSAEPGYPPLRVTVNKAGAHQLVLKAIGGELDVDQVWFSRSQREFPTFSEPLVP
jgi:hypothetical protein